MVQKFGTTFRSIRESKGVSLNSLSDDVVSKSMISKFENSLSDLSTQRFFHLLEKINVTPYEFQMTMNNYELSGDSKTLNALTELAMSQNVISLQRYTRKLNQKYTDSQSIFDQLNWIMAEAMLANIQEKKLADNVDLKALTNYLFSCEDWGNYELILYGNTMSVLPLETINIFSGTLFEKCSIFQGNSSLYEMYLNILLNTIELLIKREKYSLATKFISSFERQNLSEAFLLERTFIRFYKGIIMLKTGDEETGHTLTEGALAVFDFAGCDAFTDSLKQLM
ncbi:transcriptional regulator [Lapidilactobacillus concavus]|nr:Rgg/GadR/MutR family transcriptional regulator [Lapidilactobacillus concavus]GEL13852.1 transcriptional regulator [Lapidilactobacillus concavus]